MNVDLARVDVESGFGPEDKFMMGIIGGMGYFTFCRGLLCRVLQDLTLRYTKIGVAPTYQPPQWQEALPPVLWSACSFFHAMLRLLAPFDAL